MVALAIGKSRRSAKPELRVTGKLAQGRHRFALEVVAADGRRSIQDVVIVEVLAPVRVADRRSATTTDAPPPRTPRRRDLR